MTKKNLKKFELNNVSGGGVEHLYYVLNQRNLTDVFPKIRPYGISYKHDVSKSVLGYDCGLNCIDCYDCNCIG